MPHNGIVSFRSSRASVVSFASHEPCHPRYSMREANLLLIHLCLTSKFSGLTRFGPTCRTGPRRQEAGPPVYPIRRPRGHPGIILVDTRRDTGARKNGPGASERLPAPCTSFWREHLDHKGAFRPSSGRRQPPEPRRPHLAVGFAPRERRGAMKLSIGMAAYTNV